MSDNRPNIWRLQTKFDTQGLIEALKNDDPGIRKRAAAALRALGVIDAIPALRDALAGEHDTETHTAMSAALDELLAERDEAKREAQEVFASRPRTQVEILIEQLNTSNHEQLLKTIRQLAELKNKQAVESLVVLFKNAELPIRIRLAAAEALLQLEGAPSEVSLLGALRSPAWHIRRNGAAILGQMRADWAVEPLAKALRDTNEAVRRTAYAALKHIGTPEALNALQEARRAALQSGVPTATSEVKAAPAAEPVTGKTATSEVEATPAAEPVTGKIATSEVEAVPADKTAEEAPPEPQTASTEQIQRAGEPTQPLPLVAPEDGLLSRLRQGDVTRKTGETPIVEDESRKTPEKEDASPDESATSRMAAGAQEWARAVEVGAENDDDENDEDDNQEDDSSGLSWPKRKKTHFRAPTRPLDPNRLQDLPSSHTDDTPPDKQS